MEIRIKDSDRTMVYRPCRRSAPLSLLVQVFICTFKGKRVSVELDRLTDGLAAAESSVNTKHV